MMWPFIQGTCSWSLLGALLGPTRGSQRIRELEQQKDVAPPQTPEIKAQTFLGFDY